MKKYLVHILLVIGFIGVAQQTPSIQTTVDTTNIRIGEQFQYKITVDKNSDVIFPELQRLGYLEVVETADIDTIKNQLVKKYVLTGFDSGSFIIPQQQLLIENKKFLTDSILINVATVAVDTTVQKMFPIKAILKEPFTFDDVKPHLWWIILVLVLIAITVYFMFIRKKIVKEEKLIVAIPPYEEALTRLSELDAKQLWQNNKIKQYYIELTDIIRSYIESELHIPALESTTDDLIAIIMDFNNIKTFDIPKETVANLKVLLHEADLVKFAKLKPMAPKIEADRVIAGRVLTDLKPKIVVEDVE